MSIPIANANAGDDAADDGVDADAAARRYRAALRPGLREAIDITGYDRAGVPTVAVTHALPGAPAAHGVGYGVTVADATMGALGELAEEVLSERAFLALTPTRASYAELVGRRGVAGVVDPLTLVLPAGCDYTADRPLDWVPLRRWRTGEEVLVPVEFAASEPASLPAAPPPGGWLTTAISNGRGAGDTTERAVAHGLLELVQRDGDTVSFRALDQGLVVDDAALTDPLTRGLLDRLRATGIDATVKLASTELACVVYCVGRDTDPTTTPLAVTAIGEAAHPDREVAIRKAVLEFGASRARRAFAFGALDDVRGRHPDYLDAELAVPLGEQEPRALETMTDWTRRSAAELTALLEPTVLARRATVALQDLPTSPVRTPQDVLALMLDRLAEFDVLTLTTGDENARVAKVVVPGLEVETLSYLRIGERVLRRLLDRGDDFVGLGPATAPHRLPIPLTAAATERIGGPAWLDRRAVDAMVGPLYPLYREPSRHAVARLATRA